MCLVKAHSKEGSHDQVTASIVPVEISIVRATITCQCDSTGFVLLKNARADLRSSVIPL